MKTIEHKDPENHIIQCPICNKVIDRYIGEKGWKATKPCRHVILRYTENSNLSFYVYVRKDMKGIEAIPFHKLIRQMESLGIYQAIKYIEYPYQYDYWIFQK